MIRIDFVFCFGIGIMKDRRYGSFRIGKEKSSCSQKITSKSILKCLKFATNASAGEGGSSVEFDVPFPSDYTQLLSQAILMQRGNNGEGGEGLYTLKSNSSSDGQISHVVAFEDSVDATNFCYLLQSFFDDLEDFTADIVPITVKELKEVLKLRTMKVIVVKKGQLRLYASQPLGDAEMALRGMVGQ